MALRTKNIWGSANQNTDQQRQDLFRVEIRPPSILTNGSARGGVSLWDESIAFAVTKFPFPTRSVDTFTTKYLNQTNHQLGAETATSAVSMTVRYAFQRDTAVVLEKWFSLSANVQFGIPGRTSLVKTDGRLVWLIPDVPVLRDGQDFSSQVLNTSGLVEGAEFVLEGVMMTGLKPTDPDMETAGGVVYDVTWSVDRYYPRKFMNAATKSAFVSSLTA